MPLRFLTSGESHGKALTGILEGIPSGLLISSDDIDKDLKRRQGGYGRGGRMKIEQDRAQILSGVRFGKTIGSPITILIENKDWQNWQDIMRADFKIQSSKFKEVTKPRPGHADLAGAIKYDTHDIRNILERSSARETAMRVALGAVAKRFLADFNVVVGSYVIRIGSVQVESSHLGESPEATRLKVQSSEKKLLKNFDLAEKSQVRCPDKNAAQKMVRLIDKAIKEGNSLGGIFEVFATGLPVGLGSHTQWDRKLDGKLAQATMSIQAIKGVEIGLGFEMGRRFGSEVMDEIYYTSQKPEVKSQKSELHAAHYTLHAGFYRKTNYAGGIEGGMTNGMPVILRAVMKPIPTLRKPLWSIDINTRKPFRAAYERSDVCAVPAAAVVGEAMAALIIADAFLEKFGGDSMAEVKRNYNSYLKYLSMW